MSQKKRLKLEVKTLEARIAPGTCNGGRMNSLYTNPMTRSNPGAHYTQPEPAFSGNGGRDPGGEPTKGGGAGVPVIGIN